MKKNRDKPKGALILVLLLLVSCCCCGSLVGGAPNTPVDTPTERPTRTPRASNWRSPYWRRGWLQRLPQEQRLDKIVIDNIIAWFNKSTAWERELGALFVTEHIP